MNVKIILMAISVAYFGGLVNGGIVRTNEVYDDDISEYFGVQIYKIERVCAMVGGFCVHKDNCAPGQLTSTSGLCPENKHLGVECCYQVEARPTTCRKQLGECMPYCTDEVKISTATDCPDGTQCCLLI